jgi:hypothetical protein
LLIAQCGNLCFAIEGVFGRANRGGDYDSWFFRCRNLSFGDHGANMHPERRMDRGEETVLKNLRFFRCRNLSLLLKWKTLAYELG